MKYKIRMNDAVQDNNEEFESKLNEVEKALIGCIVIPEKLMDHMWYGILRTGGLFLEYATCNQKGINPEGAEAYFQLCFSSEERGENPADGYAGFYTGTHKKVRMLNNEKTVIPLSELCSKINTWLAAEEARLVDKIEK